METNNKLIAEFLGYIDNGCSEEGFLIDPKTNYDVCIDSLQFHTDWNWLMEVVEKITSILMLDDNFKYNYLYIGYDFEDKEHYVNLYVSEDIQLNGSSKNSKIQAVYNACLEFIKWYNENKI